MIEAFIIAFLIQSPDLSEPKYFEPAEIKIEAGRKRGKKQRGRRRGGNGLR